jgi:hypothetical protein
MSEELTHYHTWVVAVLGNQGFNDPPELEEKRSLSNSLLKNILSKKSIKVIVEAFS